ncbi:MAG: prepilin-type N-terminal cleavage/methylation domain-containing protein [Planctomycetes bacterium]|nr:prepilin-type N-terminal cleavage/methylation domain-containing protein [Planctomycetota bacterium]
MSRATAARRHAVRRQQGGFTLLEVMAALSIFLVGITSVLALLSTGTRLHQDSLGIAQSADAAGELLLLAERELVGNDQPPRAPPSATPVIQRAAADFESIGRPLPGRDGLRWYWWVEGGGGALPLRLRVEVIWLQGGKIRVEPLERIVPRAQSARAEAEKLLRER